MGSITCHACMHMTGSYRRRMSVALPSLPISYFFCLCVAVVAVALYYSYCASVAFVLLCNSPLSSRHSSRSRSMPSIAILDILTWLLLFVTNTQFVNCPCSSYAPLTYEPLIIKMNDYTFYAASTIAVATSHHRYIRVWHSMCQYTQFQWNAHQQLIIYLLYKVLDGHDSINRLHFAVWLPPRRIDRHYIQC